MSITSNLDPQQLSEIRELTKHREWLSFWKLLQTFRANLLKEALSWTNPNDAFVTRGKLRSVDQLLDTLLELNNNVHATDSRSDLLNLRLERSGRGQYEPSPDEYFESTPTKPSY